MNEETRNAEETQLNQWLNTQALPKPGDTIWAELSLGVSKLTVSAVDGCMVICEDEAASIVVHVSRAHRTKARALQALISIHNMEAIRCRHAVHALQSMLKAEQEAGNA